MSKDTSEFGACSEQAESTGGTGIGGTLFRWLPALLVTLGLTLLVFAVPYVALQLVRCTRPSQNLAGTYLGLAVIPLAMGLFLRGGFRDWVERRRTVECAELEGLYSEVERYASTVGEDAVRKEAAKQAQREVTRLKSLGRAVLELDALPLRYALADLYSPEAELIAMTRGELEYLGEYADVEGTEGTARVNKTIEELEKSMREDPDNAKPDMGKRAELERGLCANLKSLRNTTAWYDRTWAIGEWMRTCVTFWACVAVVITMLVGILPVVHSKGNWNLCIVHWAVLGTTGALLSILLRLHSLDVPELGETEGKDLIQGTIRSIAIGALTAVLLYAAIWGGALEGVMFPNLPLRVGRVETVDVQPQGDVGEMTAGQAETKAVERSLKDVGLSIFWAVFAGLSPVILRRMSRVVESSLGEQRQEGSVQ